MHSPSCRMYSCTIPEAPLLSHIVFMVINRGSVRVRTPHPFSDAAGSGAVRCHGTATGWRLSRDLH